MRVLLWFGWLLMASITTASIGSLLTHRRPHMDGPVLPCDACDRLVSATHAHLHYHEPGCGIDDPLREQCRCDFLLCPSCCGCGLLAAGSRP